MSDEKLTPERADESDELDEAEDDIFDHAVDEMDPELQPWVGDVMDRTVRAYLPSLMEADDVL